MLEVLARAELQRIDEDRRCDLVRAALGLTAPPEVIAQPLPPPGQVAPPDVTRPQ